MPMPDGTQPAPLPPGHGRRDRRADARLSRACADPRRCGGRRAAPAVLNAWVRIAPDDTVTLLLSQSEMGQGVYTSLPMILAEELECDWPKVRIEMAPVGEAYQNPAFHMQGTGGSTSVRAFMQPLRQAGAAAREMLKLAAAKRWGVPVARVSCRGRRRRAWPEGPDRNLWPARRCRCGAPAAGRAAAQGGRPVPPDRPAGRRASICRTRCAAPRRSASTCACPAWSMRRSGSRRCSAARSRSIANRAEVESRRGVLAVVPLEDAVAVVAEHFWQAKTAADALDVAWAEGAGAGRRRCRDHGAVPLLDRRRGGGRVGAR